MITLSDPALGFLLLKMLAAVVVVVTASIVSERTGPLIAAMVATLPVSAGPIYVFLALEHTDGFIASALVSSVGSNFATTAFVLAYVVAAQRFGMLLSLFFAYLFWAPVLLAFKQAELPVVALLALILLVFPLAHFLIRDWLAARPKELNKLAWYAIPVRALFVALLVAVVTTLSASIGPQWSGYFATYPVVMTTLIIFLHPRFGGPATAAILGNSVMGLMGFGLALCLAHLIALSFGKWWALAVGLVWCIGWNLALVLWARRNGPKPGLVKSGG